MRTPGIVIFTEKRHAALEMHSLLHILPAIQVLRITLYDLKRT